MIEAIVQCRNIVQGVHDNMSYLVHLALLPLQFHLIHLHWEIQGCGFGQIREFILSNLAILGAGPDPGFFEGEIRIRIQVCWGWNPDIFQNSIPGPDHLQPVPQPCQLKRHKLDFLCPHSHTGKDCPDPDQREGKTGIVSNPPETRIRHVFRNVLIFSGNILWFIIYQDMTKIPGSDMYIQSNTNFIS